MLSIGSGFSSCGTELAATEPFWEWLACGTTNPQLTFKLSLSFNGRRLFAFHAWKCSGSKRWWGWISIRMYIYLLFYIYATVRLLTFVHWCVVLHWRCTTTSLGSFGWHGLLWGLWRVLYPVLGHIVWSETHVNHVRFAVHHGLLTHSEHQSSKVWATFHSLSFTRMHALR